MVDLLLTLELLTIVSIWLNQLLSIYVLRLEESKLFLVIVDTCREFYLRT